MKAVRDWNATLKLPGRENDRSPPNTDHPESEGEEPQSRARGLVRPDALYRERPTVLETLLVLGGPEHGRVFTCVLRRKVPKPSVKKLVTQNRLLDLGPPLPLRQNAGAGDVDQAPPSGGNSRSCWRQVRRNPAQEGEQLGLLSSLLGREWSGAGRRAKTD